MKKLNIETIRATSLQQKLYTIIRIILTIISITLLIHSTLSTSIYTFTSNEIGIVSRLPKTYWIGMFSLILLWFTSYEIKIYNYITFALTIGYLFISPALIYKPVYLSNSYYPFSEALLINKIGHLIPRRLDIFTSYHYWPIFLYLSSIFTLVTGMEHYIILKVFPILTIILYGVFIFLILKIIFNTKNSILGSCWSISSFWLRQYYFGPPGISYIFFLLILLVILWLYSRQNMKKFELLILYAFLFIIISLTHLLASVFTIVGLITLYLTDKYVLKRSLPYLSSLMIYSALILAVINTVFVPEGFQIFVVKTLSNAMSGILKLSLFQEPSRIVGSTAMYYNYYSSWIIVLLNVIPALIGIAYTIRNYYLKNEITRNDEYAIFYTLFLFILGFFGISGWYGSHEAYQRAFMFGLLPLSYLSINYLKKWPKIIIVFLGLLLILNIPAQYGSDNFRIATSKQLSGSNFFSFYTPDNTQNLGKFSLYVRYYDPLKHFEFQQIGVIPFTSIPETDEIKQLIENSDYLVFSDLLENYYYYYLGQDIIGHIDVSSFNNVYDNSGFKIISTLPQ